VQGRPVGCVDAGRKKVALPLQGRPAGGLRPPAAGTVRSCGTGDVVNISELRLQFMGWESQRSRVQRHARRIQQAVQGDPTAYAWDDVINFFIHSFSLLDWLESDGLITTAKKRQLLAQAPLSVSRDIANAAKHRHLNRPSHPGGIALVREYAPHATGRRSGWLSARGRKRQLLIWPPALCKSLKSW